MEALMIIISAILWITGGFFVLAAIFEDIPFIEVFILLLLGIVICNGGRLAYKHKNSFNEQIVYAKPIYRYKVKELEKNTVFNISDSIGGFKPKDTVWVNYTTLMVDPLDSIAMKVVIIEEIK